MQLKSFPFHIFLSSPWVLSTLVWGHSETAHARDSLANALESCEKGIQKSGSKNETKWVFFSLCFWLSSQSQLKIKLHPRQSFHSRRITLSHKVIFASDNLDRTQIKHKIFIGLKRRYQHAATLPFIFKQFHTHVCALKAKGKLPRQKIHCAKDKLLMK